MLIYIPGRFNTMEIPRHFSLVGFKFSNFLSMSTTRSLAKTPENI